MILVALPTAISRRVAIAIFQTKRRIITMGSILNCDFLEEDCNTDSVI
jgi:hypothetical protein